MRETILLTNGDRELWMDAERRYFGKVAAPDAPVAPEPRVFSNYYEAVDWLQEATLARSSGPRLPGWLRRQG